MIPVINPTKQMPTWQDSLRSLVRDPLVLLQRVGLADCPQRVAAAQASAALFPVRTTDSYIARMRVGDVNDPLLRQVLPLSDEGVAVVGFGTDPIGESGFMDTRGLLQKYEGRALILATGACAINCRYCFRRHYPYGDNTLTDAALDAVVEQIQSQGLTEIILSGGDPLMLPTEKLQRLVARCMADTQVTTVRIHTRLPVVLPSRLDAPFCTWWNALPLHKVMVIHANHANEIDAEVTDALRQLTGTQILNQAVLLRGVNDSANALIELSRASFAAGALPYYLHLLDPVAGAAHFDVGETEARGLMAEMLAALPGYLVPHLVRETAGAQSKTRIL
jgi:EF-P beta-lysylation protein EpmB